MLATLYAGFPSQCRRSGALSSEHVMAYARCPPRGCLSTSSRASAASFVPMALGQIAQAIFGPLGNIEQGGNRRAGDLRRFDLRLTFGGHPPDSSRMAIAPLVAQRILRVPLHRVVPVADIKVAAGAELQI